MIGSRFTLLVLTLLLYACEKDDICNEGTPGTPRLVVRLFDNDNPSALKSATGYVRALDKEDPYLKFSSDSIYFPYNTTQNFTRYAFGIINSTTNDTIIDTLQLNYHSRVDTYTRRACGFSAVFTIADPAFEVLHTPRWFVRSSVLTQTLKDEEQAHVAIYH